MAIGDAPFSKFNESERTLLTNGAFNALEIEFSNIPDLLLSSPPNTFSNVYVKPTGFHADIVPIMNCSPRPLQKLMDQRALFVAPCDEGNTMSTSILDIGNVPNSSTTPTLLSDCDESFASDHTSNQRQPQNQLQYEFDLQQMVVGHLRSQTMQGICSGKNNQAMLTNSSCSLHPGLSTFCFKNANDVELDLDLETIFDDQ
eukprot:CAMPEP_0197274026 /NCGR_PEP_ID=MMETSP1432-20130617/12091_1 /TAXON_ID=44447 /ORGANISM="Pseudo-nitzschia delicatissima, Strain UNC1205" /LENGTH=200 /DNA_ID=CAMNT_0042739771 /DNA_START=207 /DNA_END=809 /DNA_ORIENTATION=+